MKEDWERNQNQMSFGKTFTFNHTPLKAREGTTIAILSHKVFLFAILAEGCIIQRDSISSVENYWCYEKRWFCGISQCVIRPSNSYKSLKLSNLLSPCVDRNCTLCPSSYCPIFAEWQQLKEKNKFTWGKQEAKALSDNLERKLKRMSKMGVREWSRWPEVPSDLNYIFLLWKHKNLQTQNAQDLNLFSVQEGISRMHLWVARAQFDNPAPYILSAEHPYSSASRYCCSCSAIQHLWKVKWLLFSNLSEN